MKSGKYRSRGLVPNKCSYSPLSSSSSSKSSNSISPSSFEDAGAPTSYRHNFITNIIKKDLLEQKHGGIVRTRFPPEPNGYLHLGHAKSICLNFGIASQFGGKTNMRFDDTNPAKEDVEYVNAILDDVRWLLSGRTKTDPPPWDGEARHTSDYFQLTFESALYLIEKGRAYVDDLTLEEMKEYRGTLTKPGKNSPYRDRSMDENMSLFLKMKNGDFPDGKCVLRAKIDMASPNINMRDPALYRIKRDPHPLTGKRWLIYPMYDFAHAISDAKEEITHSLCTLEFQDHRPLYDWVIDNLRGSGLLSTGFESRNWRPIQIEFSRLNLQYTVLSKRKLIQLVDEGHVSGWDDPRMPTLCGIRRRGFPAEAIQLFCERVGISKAENNIDMSVLEDCAREILGEMAPRALAILNPLKVTLTNWPAGKEEEFVVDVHPTRKEMGSRIIPFSDTFMIERDDFWDTGVNENLLPPKGFKRLTLGGEVRLRYAYVITCHEVVRDSSGEPIELLCTYDHRTRAGVTPEGNKRVKGIIQWVSYRSTAVSGYIRLYDRLFSAPSPGKDHEDGDFLKDINVNSLRIVDNAVLEPSVCNMKSGDVVQFERLGYFCLDTVDNQISSCGRSPLKFNRIVTLKDSWSIKSHHTERSMKKGDIESTKDIHMHRSEDDILSLDFRVGRILDVKRHPDADSLYVEKIDLGEEMGPRTIVSGLVAHYEPDELLNKLVVVVANLKPVKVRGILSSGMILCGRNEQKSELLHPPMGSRVGEGIQVDGLGKSQPGGILKTKSAQVMFKRVLALLNINENGEGCYRDQKLMTSLGVCTTNSLKNSSLR